MVNSSCDPTHQSPLTRKRGMLTLLSRCMPRTCTLTSRWGERCLSIWIVWKSAIAWPSRAPKAPCTIRARDSFHWERAERPPLARWRRLAWLLAARALRLACKWCVQLSEILVTRQSSPFCSRTKRKKISFWEKSLRSSPRTSASSCGTPWTALLLEAGSTTRASSLPTWFRHTCRPRA